MAEDTRAASKNAQDENGDAFWLTDLYPDAASLFQHQQTSLKDITAECVVILDANVLLWLFELGATSVDEVAKVYEKLASEQRLIVPGQAAREFYRHRSNKVAAVADVLDGAISRARRPPLDSAIPLLSNDADYAAARQLNAVIAKSGEELAKRLSVVTERLKEEIGNDRVSQIYRRVLPTCIAEIPLQSSDRKKILLEAERRARLKIAPGYKDQNKEDKGVGDLIIWLTVLDIGSKKNSHCIFVTNEGKSDWWIKSRGAFQPRPELIEEYRQSSNGKSIHLLPLSSLLANFKAEAHSIEELQKLEVQRRENNAEDSNTIIKEADDAQLSYINDIRKQSDQFLFLTKALSKIDSDIHAFKKQMETTPLSETPVSVLEEIERLYAKRDTYRKVLFHMQQATKI